MIIVFKLQPQVTWVVLTAYRGHYRQNSPTKSLPHQPVSYFVAWNPNELIPPETSNYPYSGVKHQVEWQRP